MKLIICAALLTAVCGAALADDFNYRGSEYIEIQTYKNCYEATHFHLSEAEREAMLAEKFEKSRFEYNAELLAADTAIYQTSDYSLDYRLKQNKIIKATDKCLKKYKKELNTIDYTPNYSDDEFTAIGTTMICTSKELANTSEDILPTVIEKLAAQEIDFSEEKFTADDKYRRAYTSFYEDNPKVFYPKKIVCP